MSRCLRGVGLLVVMVCAAAATCAQAGYGGGQAANPAGYGGAPAMMVVPTVGAPDFRGMTLTEAQAANVVVPTNGTQANAAQRAIFSKLNTTGPTDGVVDAQTPAAGTKVRPGQQAATLTMKAAQITVPVLKGMSVAEARSRLSQSSLVLGQVSGDATLKIATQTPTAGTSVAPLTVVDVVMSAPAGVAGATGAKATEVKLIAVPNVLTLREAAALAKLTSAGLGKPTVLGPASGVVVRQTPMAGTTVAEGSRVRLVMGTQNNNIIVVQKDGVPWVWYAAGGVVLLGAIGAFVAANRTPIPPKPKRIAVPPVAATMVAKPNAAPARLEMKSEPALRWSVQLRGKPAVGVTTVKDEIEGRR